VVVIAVTGGKGGTGKTLVAVNLSVLLAENEKTLLVDLDADNPCVPSLLNVELSKMGEVRSFRPVINTDKCTLCGECAKTCPAHALILIPNKLLFIETLCEGCAACLYICKEGAISEGLRVSGWLLRGGRGKLGVLVAEARVGERKTDEVAEEALRKSVELAENYDWVVLDTPAGTGRIIKRAVDSSDVVLLVTEPTKLGVYDLKKTYKLVEGKTALVVVSKYGVKGGAYEELREFLREKALTSVCIPYDVRVVKSSAEGRPIVEAYPKSPPAKALGRLADLVRNLR